MRRCASYGSDYPSVITSVMTNRTSELSSSASRMTEVTFCERTLNERKSKVTAIVVWAAVAGLSIWILATALWVFPQPFADARSFISTAITFAKGGGLTTVMYPVLDDWSGQRRVLYVPLFHWLLGMTMPTPDIKGALVTLAIWSSASLAISAYLLRRVLTAGDKSCSWAGAILTVGALATISLRLLPAEGRPEILATLLLLLALLVVYRVKASIQWLPLGMLLGFMGATDAVAALMCAALLISYFAVTHLAKRALAYLVACAFTSVAVFLLVLLISPNGILDTIKGMAAGARESIIPSWGSWNYWFFAGRTPLSGITVAVSTIFAIWLWVHYRTQIKCQSLFWLGVLFFCAFAWYFSLRAPARNYNLLVFTPLACLLFVHVWKNIELNSRRGPFGKFAFPLALAATAGPVLGVTRYMFLFAIYICVGTHHDAAQRSFINVVKTHEAIYIHPNLWLLSEDFAATPVMDIDRRAHGIALVKSAIELDHSPVAVERMNSSSRQLLESARYHLISEFGNDGSSGRYYTPSFAFGYGYAIYQK
jgi:hypothetical protein